MNESRLFLLHHQFFQPLLRYAAFAVEDADHLTADRRRRVGVIAEVCGFERAGLIVRPRETRCAPPELDSLTAMLGCFG